MIIVKIEPIFSKKGVFDTKKWKKAIENAGNMSSKAVKVDFMVTTATWTHQPNFEITRPNDSTWQVSTDDKIYGYVDSGTPRHPISAKNAPSLAFFKDGFRPKTRPGWIGSNKGSVANKNLRRPKTVMHPGTTAREFAKAIKKKWDEEWPRQIARAIRAQQRYGG